MWKWDILYHHLAAKKRFQGESLLVDKHSVFRFFVLRVENKALESGTKQCSFHVHGGQVKSKALLEVEIIIWHLQVHLWLVEVGIILVCAGISSIYVDRSWHIGNKML